MQTNNKFEVTVSLPLDDVLKRLEGARKEMAPKIGTCTVTSDTQSFICPIYYANAFALIKAQASADGKETKVLVDIQGSTVFMKPFGITLVSACVVITVVVEAFFIHPKNAWDWLYLPLASLFYPIASLLIVPLSKQVLARFVHETLLNDG